MSAANTAAINCIYSAFENRDVSSVLGLLSPEIHITQSAEIPWGGVFQGLAAARLFFEQINTYLDGHVAIERCLDGGERMAVIGRIHGTIRSSGLPLDIPLVHLWAFKDGLAVRLEIVIDVPTMRAALT